jgi:mono/diheme cytochrome c family protein
MTHQSLATGLLLTAIGLAASGQRTTPPVPAPMMPPSLYGRDIFELYCAPCHGLDGRGSGPVARVLKAPPPDLTRLAVRNNGVFPRARVELFVTSGSAEAPAHGSSQMPIWGPTFRALGSSAAEAKVRIANVVDYVGTLQNQP